jgi:hypothetical protein
LVEEPENGGMIKRKVYSKNAVRAEKEECYVLY